MVVQEFQQNGWPLADSFDEDETERLFLESKPTCFLIIGKPGTGKATLGRKISQAWKCVYVEASELIEEHLRSETEYGLKMQELLVQGLSVPEELVTKLIVDKINTAEVGHVGYVLCGLPSPSEEYLSIGEQIDLIKNLPLKPDIIINIKCPDYDLNQRLSGQKQDPGTGQVYQREQWNPTIPEKKKKKAKPEGEEEEEEAEEEELEEVEEEQVEDTTLTKEILDNLVIRPEDFPENVDARIEFYKDIMLCPLEDVMADHDPLYLFELDGNKKLEELFVSILARLESLGVRKGAPVIKLQSTDEDEVQDIEDNDELFRTLASVQLVAPRYRWRRSRWGRGCPVALKEGSIKMGVTEFSVSFLDKMYILSSEEALRKFMSNPRPFLLPPMPFPPCKVVVFGPPFSGKTTLCNLLAEKYQVEVLDLSEIFIPHLEEAKTKALEVAQAEALEVAIQTVKMKLAQEKLKKEEEDARAAAAKELEEAEVHPGVEDEKSQEEEAKVTFKPLEARPEEGESELAAVGTEETTTTEPAEMEVTADHPEVQALVEESLKISMQTPVTLSPDAYAAILKDTIQEYTEDCNERVVGAAPVGGWILDNFPKLADHWIAIINKGIVPDTVICLMDTQDNGKFLLNRLYLQNRDGIDTNLLQRLEKEKKQLEKETEEARREQQEMLRLQAEEKYKQEHQPVLETVEEIPEEAGTVVGPAIQTATIDQLQEGATVEEEAEKAAVIEQTAVTTDPLQEVPLPQQGPVVLPTVPEGDFPDVPEMEPFKQSILAFTQEYQLLEHTIKESFNGDVVNLEIGGKSPEALLREAAASMEKSFKYHGWEMSSADLDEEEEDNQAELEAEENVEEEENKGEEEEEEEEDEEAKLEKKKHFGDTKNFCPVALKDKFVLWPGSSEYAAKYREKVYYFSSAEAKDKFLQNPEEYVALKEPLKAPPLRVFLLGTRGAGKSTSARWLADKLGIFHIQFQERLQEIMLAKLEKKVGPEFEEEPLDDPNDIPALLEMESDSPPKTESDSLPKKEPDSLPKAKTDSSSKTEPDSSSKTELDPSPTTEPGDDEDEKKNELALTEDEEAIKSYLTDNEPLPGELLNQIVTQWWTTEPFRSTGFILDDFPRTMEEAQFVGEHGLFPDIAVLLQVEENDVSDRLLPPRLAKWKERYRKKEEYKQKLKEMKKKIRDDKIAKRRAELLAERSQKQESKQPKEDVEHSEEEDIEEEEEEEEDDTELVLAEEFPEEEEIEEEPEEQEEEAIERLKSEIGEKVEAEIAALEAVKEELQRLKIPFITINGARKAHIVRYLLYEKLKHLVENRESIFEKCYPISVQLADKMLRLSYKHPSIFGRWDPLRLFGGDVIKLFKTPENPSFPVIYRQYIYFFSNKENRDMFMKNPVKYLHQPKPKPPVPIRIAIVGPPKSGKSTVARMLSTMYGFQRLSIGDAIRSVLDNQPQTELALEIKKHLHSGLTVPNELAIQCLEVSLMDLACNTVGVILDGYPVTKRQVDMLESQNIIPVKIIELKINTKEVLKRGLLDKKSSDRPYPLPDSPQMLALRNSCYKQEIKPIKEFYEQQHQNWYEIDSWRSKWWIWNKVTEEMQASIKCIQIYLERIKEGKAVSINGLCITPEELQARLGEFGQYSPVSLAQKGELVDCSVTPSLQFAAEFRGHYYKMASQEELNEFLDTPHLFVPPLAPYSFPSSDMLPKKLTVAEVKAQFPKIAELQGYCPVTYLDGKQRYEALVHGHIENAVEYRDKIFIFESEEKLQKFMRLPEKYWNLKLPHKLPPKKEPILLSYLPLSGYLEQGAATALIKAMNDVGCLKPKFPFLSVKRSALLYLAFHLKAYNPRQPDYIRKKYKKKMDQFLENCELITYLGNKMTRKYKEPQHRPIDFDFKLRAFLSLKDVDLTC
ncbi:adenylate kinase 9 isoform X2 [Ambystoma mexicanum]|uniref:adenylate kinase 9 isoform X2 n=1 Tax=Ambystoma mexicanum TaxID=8296 RepID=UPI0037E99392